MALSRSSWWLVGAAAVIIAIPQMLPQSATASKGSDELAKEAILAINPDYKPWFTPVWTPPNAEVESLLFAIQAGLGAGILGYVIGRRR
ncbi:MAG: energy-coupling factor ABC transporter substrate-binding protein [Magnetococcales bacterium]|nr:energy-coupling factor ABC transporter substrate-binding protein [Magnetococcales bacterium]MBF0419997.1 energy-coupling factor ABC transporter substrate-binding protein [Magnetococcales bacterium]